MGKKKLSASQKLLKLQDKKKKDAERKDILLGLQQGLEKSNESHILDKMASIKNMNVQMREDRRAQKDVKHAAKMAKIGTQEQKDIEEEFEDDDGSASEPDLEKKLKTDDAEKKDKKKNEQAVNIFAMTEYVNANKQTEEELAEEDAVYQAKLQKIRDAQNSQSKLESEAKRLIPGLSLETFDGAKTTRRVMEELSTTDAQRELKAKQQEEFYKEIEHDDFIEDELIKEITQGQQKVQNYVNRTEQQSSARSKLPIIMREADILEAVDNNLITLLCGETGSGKSTQTVQFLYEAGYTNKSGPNPGMIGVTQPRRIAAIALAKRVADEMGMSLGKEVVYQVRHEHSSFNEDSAIKFMTDGILMNEMCSDFLLRKYSVIVIDEAHERKINTDLLLGLLSRLVNIRARLALEERRNASKDQTEFKYYPLRVIIMSATLRVEDFTGNKYLLPKKVNVINVEARQYPVNIYFSKRTPDDYLQAAVKKCAKIHAELPPGDVLVFLTGEREIKEFCITLGQVLGRKQKILEQRGQSDREYQQKDFGLDDSDGEEKDQDDDDEADAENKLDEEEKNDQNGFLLGARRKLKLQAEDGQQLNKDDQVPDETENLGIITHNPIESENLKGVKKSILNFKILPLYSKLPLQEQEKIFKDKTPGTRLIIAATNVAETSLTIPNIKYVVDTGREKKKVYSTKVAISQHFIKWISQASGDQRSGRAGRTSPGYCYRLYAPSVFANIFQPFSDPEILHMPLESVVLHLKAIGIQDVIKFPYPTPPSIVNLRRAIQNLVKIKALQDKEVDLDLEIQDEEIDKTDDKSEITELGRVLAFLPINPRYAKMLLQGRAAGVSVYALLLVTALTVEEIFNRSDFKIFEAEDTNKNFNLKEHEELYASDEDFKVKAKDLLKQKMNQIQEEREMKKKALEKRREEIGKFKEYFEKFMIGKSDLFIHINIIGEFVEKIYTDKPSTSQLEDYIQKYASSQHLLPKSLKEIYNNLNQITDILDSILVSDEERKIIKQGFSPYVKPNEEQQKFLIEIIVACFIDQCARKINYLDEEGRKKVAYESLESNDRVLISQTSFLIKDQPDYVVYSEILDGRKKYMNNITIVTDIGLLHKYDYRTTYRKTQYVYEPKPSFSRKKDQLMVLAKSTFSKRKWDIPIFETIFSEESLEKYCWFAKCLLEGQVFDFFKACKSAYQYDLNLIKSSNLQPKVQAIVNKLKLNQIDSAKKLKQKWAQDQSFLLPEFLLWIKDTIKPAIQKKWPPSA